MTSLPNGQEAIVGLSTAKQLGDSDLEITQHPQALRIEITELRSEVAQLRGQLPTATVVDPPSHHNESNTK